ncbi:hypothetical protein NMY22_g10142 [Coprinellus aureogranulatus]|nr:hypothetical protein NMY22_g10142 [Coprinellus aureogranulatus]
MPPTSPDLWLPELRVVDMLQFQRLIGKGKVYNFEPVALEWGRDRQVQFVEDLINRRPVGAMTMRKVWDEDCHGEAFECVDGRKRLASIKRFVRGEMWTGESFPFIKLSGSREDADERRILEDTWKNTYWRDLRMAWYVYDDITDEDCINLCERL